MLVFVIDLTTSSSLGSTGLFPIYLLTCIQVNMLTMKLYHLFLAFPFLLVLSLGSCTYSKVVEVVPINDSLIVMKASTNNVPYIAMNGYRIQNYYSLSLHATTNNNREIVININNFNGKLGFYHIGNVSTDSCNAYYTENGITHNSIYGDINVMQANPYYLGAFNFTCSDSMKVDSGYFRINPYQ